MQQPGSGRTVTLWTTGETGDAPLALSFPPGWDVHEAGLQPSTPLTPEKVRMALRKPIASPPLREVAAGKERVALIVDDLTRPTPASDLLPVLLEELEAGGVRLENIEIFVSTGSHTPPDPSGLRRRLGNASTRIGRITIHDCHGQLTDIGRSRRGTPISVNRHLMSCDLKIGVGSIYPHPAAGFSGGAKIVAPGMCGIDTIRHMHDTLRGAARRGGSLENDLREEIVEIARTIGLAFVVNVVLTEQRGVAGCFAGDPVQAHTEGVAFASALGRIRWVPDADVIVADAYPFDSTLQFAHDRALWPLARASRSASLLLIASCPAGAGSHELFPAAMPLGVRLERRIRHARLRDVLRVPAMVRHAAAMLSERRMRVCLFSPAMTGDDLVRVFPRGRLFADWPALIHHVTNVHQKPHIRVAVYRTAPLLLPSDELPD